MNRVSWIAFLLAGVIAGFACINFDKAVDDWCRESGAMGCFDGGRPDAGQSDAGQSDAGQPDAGQPDAGQRDAGMLDAGMTDAGMTDAGMMDAGMMDAGVPDAGPVISHYIMEGGASGHVVWARSIGTDADESATAVAVSSVGIFVTGFFTGSSNFNVDRQPPVASDNQDGFLLWLEPGVAANRAVPKRFAVLGGPSTARGTGVAADDSGNIFVIGTFERGAFNITTNSADELPLSGVVDSFVAKFKVDTQTGTLTLAGVRHLHSTANGAVRARGVATHEGSVVVVGDFKGDLQVGTENIYSNAITPTMFVLSFNSDLGRYDTVGFTDSCVFSQAESVVIDKTSEAGSGYGNVLVAGRVDPGDASSGCVFRGPGGSNTAPNSEVGAQPFVITYGDLTTLSGPNSVESEGYTTLDFGPEIPFKLAAKSQVSRVVAGPFRERRPDGGFMPPMSDGGTRVDARNVNYASKVVEMRPLDSEARGVAMKPSSEVYWVGGTFGDMLRVEVRDAQPGQGQTTMLSNGRAAFLVAFPAPDTSGSNQNIRWARGFRSDGGQSNGAEVTLGSAGGPYFVGDFSGQLLFQGSSLPSNGQRDLFILQAIE